MSGKFANRSVAGRVLGQKLMAFAGDRNAIVLGIPRGGVPVAYEVARLLELPLDICLARKLGVPGHEELAVGAIAGGGVRILNRDILKRSKISDALLESITAREQRELRRRERVYRGDRPPLDLRGRTAILVDDGIATGASLLAAATALQHQGAARIIAAAPVAASSARSQLQGNVSDLTCAIEPELLYAIGAWYEDFSQVSDAEVCDCLAAARPESVAARRRWSD